MQIVNSRPELPYNPSIFKNVEDKMIFVDLGAYDGDTILSTYRKFSEHDLLYIGIEPIPINFAKMEKRLSKYPKMRVRLVNKACLNAKGTFTLYSNNRDLAGGSVFRKAHHTGPTFEVEGDTLDNILEDLGIDYIDLLKVDVENAEVAAMEGFTKYKPSTQFHIEYHDYNKDRLLKVLEQMGIQKVTVYIGNDRRGSIIGNFGDPEEIAIRPLMKYESFLSTDTNLSSPIERRIPITMKDKVYGSIIAGIIDNKVKAEKDSSDPYILKLIKRFNGKQLVIEINKQNRSCTGFYIRYYEYEVKNDE